MPLTARPRMASGPANGVPGLARSEDNGSSNALAVAPLGRSHHSLRPGNSESLVDWGK